MIKDDLLRNIAETAYNVGFGAKKHFSSYDIITKVPGIIGFLSISVGIFALYIDSLSTKHLSATFIVLGVVGLYITQYDHKKQQYAEAGKLLIGLFNQLKILYFNVKGGESGDLNEFEKELLNIENSFQNVSFDEQMLFSDWYAHYKFFGSTKLIGSMSRKNFVYSVTKFLLASYFLLPLW
ncbi:membrane hypothetical protein [Gammaproteobacteria bacterium]